MMITMVTLQKLHECRGGDGAFLALIAFITGTDADRYGQSSYSQSGLRTKDAQSERVSPN